MRVAPAASLTTMANGQFVCVAGLVRLRQRPGTARGITFVTLEDETGHANLVIKQDVWERFYNIARTAAAFVAHGRMQKYGETNNEIIHIVVSKLENMAVAVRPRSRDFH